jgi:TPR repeat protein
MTMTSRWCCPLSLGWALLLAGCGPAQVSPALPSPALPSSPEDACNAGDARSCFDLGFRFSEGRGVGKDEARAAALFTKACEGGEAQGCCNLGDLLWSRSAGKDEAAAAAAFARGCALGLQIACAWAQK